MDARAIGGLAIAAGAAVAGAALGRRRGLKPLPAGDQRPEIPDEWKTVAKRQILALHEAHGAYPDPAGSVYSWLKTPQMTGRDLDYLYAWWYGVAAAVERRVFGDVAAEASSPGLFSGAWFDSVARSLAGLVPGGVPVSDSRSAMARPTRALTRAYDNVAAAVGARKGMDWRVFRYVVAMEPGFLEESETRTILVHGVQRAAADVDFLLATPPGDSIWQVAGGALSAVPGALVEKTYDLAVGALRLAGAVAGAAVSEFAERVLLSPAGLALAAGAVGVGVYFLWR